MDAPWKGPRRVGVRGSSGVGDPDRLGDLLKRSWSLLGAPGARLGALLGGPWGSWGGFGGSWWCLGGVPGGSWGALGASWTKSFVILKNLQKPKENL